MASTRSNARLIRFGIFALVLIGCGYILTRGSSFQPPSYQSSGSSSADSAPVAQVKQPAAAANKGVDVPTGKARGPLQKYRQVEGQQPEAIPQKDIPEDYTTKDKIKATFVTLARNSDLYSLAESIRHVEDRFNKKFHYDWVFLNDADFDDNFKETVSGLVSGTAKFGKIPKEHWSYPEWIDQEKGCLGS